jgi:hypothetical protein
MGTSAMEINMMTINAERPIGYRVLRWVDRATCIDRKIVVAAGESWVDRVSNRRARNATSSAARMSPQEQKLAPYHDHQAKGAITKLHSSDMLRLEC